MLLARRIPVRTNLSPVEEEICAEIDARPEATLEQCIEACLLGGLELHRIGELLGKPAALIFNVIQRAPHLKEAERNAALYRHQLIVGAVEKHQEEAVGVVVSLMNDSNSDKVRLEAAKLLLTYAAPKAPEEGPKVAVDVDFENRRARVTSGG